MPSDMPGSFPQLEPNIPIPFIHRGMPMMPAVGRGGGQRQFGIGFAGRGRGRGSTIGEPSGEGASED